MLIMGAMIGIVAEASTSIAVDGGDVAACERFNDSPLSCFSLDSEQVGLARVGIDFKVLVFFAFGFQLEGGLRRASRAVCDNLR